MVKRWCCTAMARPLAIALSSLLLLAVPATASLIEDTLAPTGLHYQEDGGVSGDAPATCQALQAARAVTLDAAATSGILLEQDEDAADVYALEITSASIGDRVSVDLLNPLLNGRYDVAIDVFSPDCASSVFDPASAYYNPPPQQPYEGSVPAGFTEREATLAGAGCDPSAWKFLANQMGGLPAPVDIYVEWTDGSYEYVPVQKSTPATIAMYRTTLHLDVTIERAVIVLPLTWKGSFHLASGPCGAVEGTPPEPPQYSPTHGEFTVMEAGTHVVLVQVTRDTVDKTTDTVEGLVNDPPTSVPLACHREVCSLATGEASYDLGSVTASE